MSSFFKKIINSLPYLFINKTDKYKDDKLRFLLDMGFALVQKPIHIFLTILLIIYFLIYFLFVAIFYFNNSLKVKVELRHLPFASIVLFSVVNTLFVFMYSSKQKQLNDFLENIKPWNSCSQRVTKKISSGVYILKYLAAALLFSNFVICVLVCPFNENRMHYINELVEAYFPNLTFVNNFLFTFFLVYAVHFSTALLFIVLYIFMNIIFQFNFISDNIEHINKLYVVNINLVDDREYQRIIKCELIGLMQQYLCIKEFIDWIQMLMNNGVIVFILAGLLIPGTCLAFIFSSLVFDYNVWICILTVILIILIIAIYSSLGQMVTDAHEDIYLASLQVPWEIWNKENKMLYQMFLIMCMKTLTFSCHGLIDLNNILLLKMYRTTMSIITWICQ